MDTTATPTLTIAYDAKRAFLNYRGLGNYCRNLFALMQQYYGEHRYVLCTPRDKGLYPQLTQAPFERLLPQGLWSLAPALWRRYGIPYALQDVHPTIYHGLSQELPEGIERLGCKTIVTMHDAIFVRYPELYSPTYRASFLRRNRSACERADLLIAISEQTKRDYMEFFGVEEQRIKVVYQGCNDLYWQPISTSQLQSVAERYALPKAYVLAVGALEERKNHLRLIEGMAAAHIDLPLVIVGRGSKTRVQALYEAARRLQVKVRIVDNVQTEDLPAIYRQASVFAYPSLFEGFGIPILEAARSEVPIVTSLGTCFEEIAGEGALYVPPTSAEAIGEALRHVLQDSSATRQRVQIALQNTEKFRAEQVAKAMMKTYMSVL